MPSDLCGHSIHIHSRRQDTQTHEMTKLTKMSLLVTLFHELHLVVETFTVSEGSGQEFSIYFLDFGGLYKNPYFQLQDTGPSKVLRLLNWIIRRR